MHAEEPLLALPPPPDGWPYWAPVPVVLEAGRPSFGLPLAETSIGRPGGALSRWASLPPELRAMILREGFGVLHPKARTVSLGAFYKDLAQNDVPSLITIDALFAVSMLAVDAALADAETHVTARAMSTLLHRLDTRLSAAEPGARPDLLDAIHAAEGVVAVALILSDPTYVPPSEVKDAVIEEAVLVRSHPGRAMSRVLHVSIDYRAFAPEGALRDGGETGTFLAAQWLAGAPFAFSANEGNGPVDMSAARTRTRAALLISRLVMASPDADLEARRALQELQRLDELVFGEPTTGSPLALADLVLSKGFDLHDAKVITDAAELDKIRRAALASLGSIDLIPLRQPPENKLFSVATSSDGGSPSAPDVAAWLAHAPRAAATSHASCYASGLDAIGAWLAPSAADRAEVFARSPEWQSRKLEGALSAWTVLRHDGVAYARDVARPKPSSDASLSPDASKDPVVIVEQHPEAIAALLSFVRQVSGGLGALQALDTNAPSRPLLAEAESILDVALTAAKEESVGPSAFTARRAELRELATRIAGIEARTTAAAGPFAAVVRRNDSALTLLEEGTTGLDSLYAVVSDPRSGRPLLAVGALVSHSEITLTVNEPETDAAWVERLRSTSPPARDRFPATIEEP